MHEILTEKEVSAWIGLSVPTLQRMRSTITGPKFIRLSKRRIVYRRADIEEWLTERTVNTLPS